MMGWQEKELLYETNSKINLILQFVFWRLHVQIDQEALEENCFRSNSCCNLLREKIGNKAMEWVRENRDAKKCAKLWVSAYKKLLK